MRASEFVLRGPGAFLEHLPVPNGALPGIGCQLEVLGQLQRIHRAGILAKAAEHTAGKPVRKNLFITPDYRSPDSVVAVYRSTSPSTISMVPMMATTSAINPPRTIRSSACRLMNDGGRTRRRYGCVELSLTIK